MTDRLEKYYWTLPFGARTETGNVAPSPFFPGRHTYQLSTTAVNGELFWLKVTGGNGLFFPRVTTKEANLREVGVFQDGATTVLVKVPVRNFDFSAVLIGRDRRQFDENILRLAYIFSIHHETASDPPGFNVINETFDVPSRWGRPNPFTFSQMKPSGLVQHIDCFMQTIENQQNIGNPDAYTANIKVSLTADNPFPYGDEIGEVLTGTYGIYKLTEPESPPTYFLDDVVPNSINYSIDTLASARTGFLWEAEFTFTSQQTLYSFGIYEVNTGSWSRFKYADYPSAGWTLPSGTLVLSFNSSTKRFQATYASGTIIALDLSVSPNSDWDDFEFIPGMEYRFFLELTEDTGTGTEVESDIFYRPRWMGM